MHNYWVEQLIFLSKESKISTLHYLCVFLSVSFFREYRWYFAVFLQQKDEELWEPRSVTNVTKLNDFLMHLYLYPFQNWPSIEREKYSSVFYHFRRNLLKQIHDFLHCNETVSKCFCENSYLPNTFGYTRLTRYISLPSLSPV